VTDLLFWLFAALLVVSALGVVLCPGHSSLQRARAVTERVGTTEVARVDKDLVLIDQTGRIEYEEFSLEALALLYVGGQCYALGENGLDKESTICQ